MKKESVNTFNEGLVYDLNPIVTPNNVLTDCINGTFLTFNGDELSLQNDAGNTTITVTNPSATLYNIEGEGYGIGDSVYIMEDGIYKYYRNLTGSNNNGLDPIDWKELVVELSEGFYPIGVKEYGGILYIISAKKPTIVPTEFVENYLYFKGDVTYKNLAGIVYYCECLTTNYSTTFPLTSNNNWFFIGNEKDFINKFGFIEFGSYPSPDALNPSEMDATVDFKCENIEAPETNVETFKFELYNPKIINNFIFQAGTYINFFQHLGKPLNTDNISYSVFRDTTLQEDYSIRKIYKIKLYHQLTNGFIDLTTDVWQKYANYIYDQTGYGLNDQTPAEDPIFWFNDETFSYYCPHNYKGKLVISVKLEELDEFSLDPTSIVLEDNNYDILFKLNYLNTTTWNQTLEPTVTVAYTIDGSPTIGTTVFHGTGLDDLTIDGFYIGDEVKTLLVKIAEVTSPNKYSWSIDNGTTWSTAEYLNWPQVYIGELGLTLKFAHMTGHTLNDYWATLLSPKSAGNVLEPDLEIPSTSNFIQNNVPLSFIDDKWQFVLSIDSGKKGQTLKYKIRPEFSFGVNLYSIDNSEPLSKVASTYLPKQFLDYHTIYGSELISTQYDDYVIEKDITTSCDVDIAGYRIYHHLNIKNLSQYITNTLVPTNDKYSFYWEGAAEPVIPPVGAHPLRYFLGKYTILDNKAYIIPTSYNTSLPLSAQNYITQLVNDTVVRVEDSTCTALRDLIIMTNRDLGQQIPVAVFQDDNVPQNIVGERIGNCSYKFRVLMSSPFTISVPEIDSDHSLVYEDIPLTIDGITSDTTIYYGILTKLTAYAEFHAGSSAPFNIWFVHFHLGYSSASFGQLIPYNSFTRTLENIDQYTFGNTYFSGENSGFTNNIQGGPYTYHNRLMQFATNDGQYVAPIIKIGFSPTTSSIYHNLNGAYGTPLPHRIIGDGHIFRTIIYPSVSHLLEDPVVNYV